MALIEKLTDIADAIRSKTGDSELLTLDEMPDAIAGISGGGSSSGLTEDFRAFVESNTPQLSFTKYSSNGTAILKSLAGSNITDIDMPNLTSIKAAIPINNTIARRIETYSITDCEIYRAFQGKCDKLEFLSPARVMNTFSSLDTKFLAYPYCTFSSYGINESGDHLRVVLWPPEQGTSIGRYDSYLKGIEHLILTRTSSLVSLASMGYVSTKIKVYVPSTMLEQYKSATNWSAIADQIYSIEDSQLLLQGIFSELDNKYNWQSGSRSLLDKLIQQKQLQRWVINLEDLIFIANDLADNGEQSIYYEDRDALIINDGLNITDNLSLVITDTFKYQDQNGDLIPLSGIIVGCDYVYDTNTPITTTLYSPIPFFLPYNNTSSEVVPPKFMDSLLHLKLNDLQDSASIINTLPVILKNNLVEWAIYNNSYTFLAPLTSKEIVGDQITNNTLDDQLYDQLELFKQYRGFVAVISGDSANGIWLRTRESSTQYVQMLYTYGQRFSLGYVYATSILGIVPAFALGKKGVNNA